MKTGKRKGFSLIELLAVCSIISLLLAFIFPALGKARRQTRMLLKLSNQRQIVTGVTTFSFDNRDTYPESVATIGRADDWHWQEPMMLTGFRNNYPQRHRAMSEYLHGYIPNAHMMVCPNAPKEYPFLQEAWDAGDAWDDPNPLNPSDPVIGTYCFYWNYIGYLSNQNGPFIGPRNSWSEEGQSRLLVSDYFGYGHWRHQQIYDTCEAYGSCEEFDDAQVTPGTLVSADFWSLLNESQSLSRKSLSINLSAGYVDGHVEKYTAAETIPLQVAITADGSEYYPSGSGPGDIYLPLNSLY